MGDHEYTSESYDSFWLTLGDTPSHGHSYNTNAITKYGGYVTTTGSSTAPDRLRDIVRRNAQALKKQPPDPSLKDFFSEKFIETLREVTPVPSALTEQQEIDEAVKEAIAKPRREAEIAKRVAAVQALGTEDKHEDGTVLRFKRSYGSSKTEYTYVSVRAGGKWYLTGSSNALGYGGVSWENLVQWMTSGDNLVFDVEIVSGWTAIPLA